MDEDLPEVIVCAGPPICMLQGEEAICAAQHGCTLCRHIVMHPNGEETVYHAKPN